MMNLANTMMGHSMCLPDHGSRWGLCGNVSTLEEFCAEENRHSEN